MSRPRVNAQGKIIIDGTGDDVLILFPCGEVRVAVDARDAEKAAKRWIAKHADAAAFNVATIEWRGIAPPSAA